MAAPLGSGAIAALVAGATSFEQQVALLVVELQKRENAYNAMNAVNPDFAPIDRVSVDPSFNTNEVAMTLNLIVSSDAVSKPVGQAVIAHLPV